MSSRERKMVWFLAVFGVLAVGVGAYMFLISPWMTARADAKKLETELADEESKLADLEAKLPKYTAYRARSLPDDATPNKSVARREYASMLNALLRSTGIPQASVSFSEKDVSGDTKNVPMLAAKTPAYTRITCDITIKKIDLTALTRFLEAYYRQPVLQQIMRLDVKQPQSEAKSGRGDLDVTIITEAIVLDGAEKRLALYPISPAQGGLIGSLGLGLLHDKPQVAAKLVPGKPMTVLAPTRDYSVLAKRDPFHGPTVEYKEYPKPEPPKYVGPAPGPVTPPVVLEDISQFIRLTGMTWRSDGTVTAEVRDLANNYEYEVYTRRNLDGVLEVRVKKFFYINANRKPMDNFDNLVISEEGTSTDRKFKVLEFRHEGLLLSETLLAPKEEVPASAATEKGSTPGKGTTPGKAGGNSGKKSTPALTKQQMNAALVGGLGGVPAVPPTKIYIWKIGTTLKQLEEVKPEPAAKPVESTPMPKTIPPGR